MGDSSFLQTVAAYWDRAGLTQAILDAIASAGVSPERTSVWNSSPQSRQA